MVRVGEVGDAAERRQSGLLPGGDTEGDQVIGARADAGCQRGGTRLGRHASDEVDGALAQRPLRFAVRTADDAPVRRVGGRAIDAGEGQCARVRPTAVPVAVEEEYGPVGNDRIERLPRGRTAREPLRAPAAAAHPCLRVVQRVGVGAHPLQTSRLASGVIEAAVQRLEGHEAQMHVGVGERGRDHAARGIQLVGARGGRAGIGERSHRDDDPVAHRDGRRRDQSLPVEHRSAGDDQRRHDPARRTGRKKRFAGGAHTATSTAA